MFRNANVERKITIIAAAGSVLYLLVIIGVLTAIGTGVPAEQVLLGGAVATATVIIISIFLTIFLSKKITLPLQRLKNIMRKINEGDLEARMGIRSGDEFEDIGNSIDNILNERVSALSTIEDENEQLNDSIVALLETVAQLAQKNLTIRAKVSEDVTGPLADALNLMTTETARVLNEVMAISSDVAEASNLVKSQSDNVLLLAKQEREEIENTATELAKATEMMSRIAKLAQASNRAADQAIDMTTTAMQTVTNTVESINQIRDTIRETEKRIKRLGERSQEISTAVNLINNISERTHILALNASMHAASAGEAGRGFAVVADEVQRLAENAREATSQIATLVNNIQVETASTVNTMNELISQVVGGSKLAEEAGEQMKLTQTTTAELVNMVQKIAAGAVAQANTSTRLRDRTQIIRDTVRKTGSHLQEQSAYTDQLVENAMSLVASVGVFQIDEEEFSN
ncbi:methyl-accepting chemotaxis protein [Methylophaga lonarensis]|uniref:methyl-accepting chemotaxis protein n=1 Tax=Methylophaga lonarensis TaxID=999151 RepID=UPI003D2721B7